MWLGLGLGLGSEYRVKIGVRVRASVQGWGLSIGLIPVFIWFLFPRLFLVKGLVSIFALVRRQKWSRRASCSDSRSCLQAWPVFILPRRWTHTKRVKRRLVFKVARTWVCSYLWALARSFYTSRLSTKMTRFNFPLLESLFKCAEQFFPDFETELTVSSA